MDAFSTPQQKSIRVVAEMLPDTDLTRMLQQKRANQEAMKKQEQELVSWVQKSAKSETGWG